MKTKEEILSCFQSEIAEISRAEMEKIQRECDNVRERNERELKEQAEKAAAYWYEQEAEELRADHAKAMSHVKDETHHKLMVERTALVQNLFDEVKQQLRVYRQSSAYTKAMIEKVRKCGSGQSQAVLQIAQADAVLLPQLLAQLEASCTGETVNDIALGGFRLVLHAQSRIIDETYDSALEAAKARFLQTSGLLIA